MEQKNKFKVVFVVVTYRNADDLFDFDASLRKNLDDYKIIIVNSFFDKITEQHIKKIAEQLNYDFITIANNGYGYGNNYGIEYAKKKYDFDYLIVSNADVIIKSFDFNNLPKDNSIIGPKITTINGKLQNPYWAYKNSIAQGIIYYGHKKGSKIAMIIGQGINKIIRDTYLLFNKNKRKLLPIYAIHGSFIIFTKDVIEKYSPIFNVNMFLYYEEAYLSKYMHDNGVNVVFLPTIDVLHKEDGSTKGSNINLSNYAKKSYLYYYENCFKRGKK